MVNNVSIVSRYSARSLSRVRLCVVIPIEGSDKRRLFAVLHLGLVLSPVDAVRAAIVAEQRGTNS